MEKIKSLLHPHGSDKDRDTAGGVTHDNQGTTHTAAHSSTAASGTAPVATASGNQAHPIYDEMTKHGHNSSTTGETPKFSNTPNVGVGTGASTSTGLEGEKHAGSVGTDGPIGGAQIASAPGNSSHLGDSSRHADTSRPQVSSGTFDGNSEASIKSGVIGFTPGSGGHGHAAQSKNNSAEERLDRNQVVGQGSTGTSAGSGLRNETIPEQPSTIPVSSGTAPHSSSTQRPHDSSLTGGADRSFPLSGGVTSGQHDSSTTHGLNTSEREPGTKDRELAGGDHHGREGLAGAAAAAAGTAAAMHGRQSESRDPQPGTLSERGASPTGHLHLTSSVREHNIHPDALHAAGIPPIKDSTEPGHGPPHETPHINTGTLLDYEKAFGSDPHTKHTGLLDYRPTAHRTGTNPHIPGEFPEPTPENERSAPILGGAGAASSTTATQPSTSHDLRHTGSLDNPSSKSADTSGHHLGRDAAIVGGVGAAGLGAAAHSKHETSASGTGNLYDEKNPYSSKAIDPRVTGGESRLDEQRFDPTKTSPASTSQPLSGSSAPVPPPKAEERQHHYGRDAAIGGGALGAGVLAGSALSGDRHHDSNLHDSSSLPTTQHASGTTNPSTVGTTSTSHQLPSTSVGTTGPHQSDTLNRVDPRVDDKAGQHHFGRDAAVVGGAGAAGYGAYEAAKAYGDHRSTQPGAAMQEQRYDPTAAGAHASNPVPATSEYNYHNPDVAALASGTGAGAPGQYTSTPGQAQQPYTTAQLAQSASSQPPQAYKSPEIDSNDLGPRDNSSRNAALGAGAGLAGATAVGYGLSHHGDTTQHTTTPGASTQPGTSSLPQPTGSLNQSQQYPHNTDSSQSHTGRDAALAGGVGAVAGAGAGYAYGQRTQPQYDPKEQERLNKEAAKHQHDLEKKHHKDIHKLEKEHEKDLKKHEKEAAHREEKEKSGGLLGFLHRDKSKKERSPESTPRRSDEHHYGRDAAVAGGVGTSAAALAGEDRDDKFGHGSGYKGRNLLRKDPPAGHPANDTLHANNRVGVDGPIGTASTDTTSPTGEHHYGRDAAIGGGAVGAGVLGAHELSKDRTEPGARETVIPSQHDSGLSGNQTTLPDRTAEHHYGRDAAISGGAVGAGGLAAHELHDKRSDPTSTTVGHAGTALAGSQQATIPGNTTSGSVIGNRDQHTPAHHVFTGGKREHIGVDGPIGDPNMISGDRQTRTGVWGAHPVEDLAKDRTVIEPRTGLPMNVGRYGDGAGGTDGGPVGHLRPETVAQQVQPGTADTQHATTNWEDVSKKNTIY